MHKRCEVPKTLLNLLCTCSSDRALWKYEIPILPFCLRMTLLSFRSCIIPSFLKKIRP